MVLILNTSYLFIYAALPRKKMRMNANVLARFIGQIYSPDTVPNRWIIWLPYPIDGQLCQLISVNSVMDWCCCNLSLIDYGINLYWLKKTKAICRNLVFISFYQQFCSGSSFARPFLLWLYLTLHLQHNDMVTWNIQIECLFSYFRYVRRCLWSFCWRTWSVCLTNYR